MSVTLIRIFTLLLTLACAVTAQAQSTRQRLDTLEQDAERLQRAQESSQTVQTEMLDTMQRLQKENQELRNQLETLQFESGRAADRQRQLYLDLDERLQKLESGQGKTAAGGAASRGWGIRSTVASACLLVQRCRRSGRCPCPRPWPRGRRQNLRRHPPLQVRC